LINLYYIINAFVVNSLTKASFITYYG